MAADLLQEKQALLHQVLSECEGEKLFKAIVNPFGSKAIEACIRLDDAAMLQTLLKDLNARYDAPWGLGR